MELEKEKRPKIFASREEMSQELTPLLECRLENKKIAWWLSLDFLLPKQQLTAFTLFTEC